MIILFNAEILSPECEFHAVYGIVTRRVRARWESHETFESSTRQLELVI